MLPKKGRGMRNEPMSNIRLMFVRGDAGQYTVYPIVPRVEGSSLFNGQLRIGFMEKNQLLT